MKLVIYMYIKFYTTYCIVCTGLFLFYLFIYFNYFIYLNIRADNIQNHYDSVHLQNRESSSGIC